MIDPRLKDKTVLITGCNNPMGIGAATAKAFAAQGANVFMTYHRQFVTVAGDDSTPGEAMYYAQQRQTADWLVHEIQQMDGSALAVELDLADSDAIPQVFDAAERHLGAVEILVNNAAYGMPDTFLNPSAEDRAAGGLPMTPFTADSHDAHFAVNSRGSALMMSEFFKRHVQRGATWGRIINISTDGAAGFASEISYGASKYALESYSRAAAVEMGLFGITVNIVSLGPIQTGYIPHSAEKAIAAQTPLRRVGQPDEAADVIVFLASEQARWLTGQSLHVGGGHLMPR